MLFSKSFENHLPKYDLVFLQEIKTIHPFHPAGFKVIRSSVLQGEEVRGRAAVMFSHKLWNYVYDMKCFQDQVWFKLSFAKNIQFGAIYVAPRDSPFYKPSSFSNIQEMSTDSKVVLIGDFNARIPNLSVLNDTNNAFSYSVNCDCGVNGISVIFFIPTSQPEIYAPPILASPCWLSLDLGLASEIVVLKLLLQSYGTPYRLLSRTLLQFKSLRRNLRPIFSSRLSQTDL